MENEPRDIGYAHTDLGAITKGMVVFDNEACEVGIVESINFAIEDTSHTSGMIYVRSREEEVAYTVPNYQINYVNETGVQLNCPTQELARV